MKFVCSGLTLSEAVNKASKACAVRTTTPIYECIKIEAKSEEVTLLATDGELSIRKSFKAEVFEEGAVCVPGKLFSDFIGKLTDLDLTLKTSEKGLEICYLDSGSAIQTLPAEEFPEIDLEIGENSFVLKSASLKKLIAKTTFCCAQDDSRPVLKGCLIEAKEGTVTFSALDGYRLAVAKKNLASMSGDVRIICPARTLNEIGRMISSDEDELEVFVQKNMLLVSIDGTVLTSRLYEGEFINISNIVPKSFSTEIAVNKNALEESVERAAVLARTDKNSILTFDIRESNMAITSNTSLGRVDESVKILLEGKDVVISLNSKYIGECLSSIGEETVRVCFNGAV